MTTLDAIALRHRSDKASTGHGYTRWYERHLSPLPTVLLEIGIAHGASLRTWRDYLGDGARVVGIDHKSDYCDEARAAGFEAHHGNALDGAFLRSVVDAVHPQVVIDDGSHEANEQRSAFHAIFPRLAPGSLYVIEDLHAAYWGWGGHFMADLSALVDKVNHGGKLTMGRYAATPDIGKRAPLDELELTVQAMHFYPSIVFIEKGDKRE